MGLCFYVFPKPHLAGSAVSELCHPSLALHVPSAVTAFGDHSETANVPMIIKNHFREPGRFCPIRATGTWRVNCPH